MEEKPEVKDENIIENKDDHKEEMNLDEESEYNEVDKKLSALMLKGWMMLADSCPLESCRCPLMKSPDGQKYCVNCESWIFDPKKRVKKKFGELIPIGRPKGKEAQVEHTEISERKVKPTANVDLLQTLNLKLNYLTNKLSQETDVHSLEVILKDINLNLDAIRKLNGY